MSLNINTSEWRLSTGGIKYKLIDGYPRGGADEESGQIEEKIIIRSADLAAFYELSFPLGTVSGDLFLINPNRRYPGLSSHTTRTISWEPFIDSKPCDPYGIDPSAPAGTYGDFVVVTITYETGKQDEDESDPETFLEISADTAGELVTVPVRGKSNFASEQDVAYAKAQGEEIQGDPVKGAMVPVTKFMPETQWTIRWPRVTRSYLPTVISAMRERLGHVNDEAVTLLFNAPRGTVLFMGFSYQEEFTWRDGGLENTPASIEFKFLEKHHKQGGNVIGHNHFIQDDTGLFKELFLPNNQPVYPYADLNNLFPPNVVPDAAVEQAANIDPGGEGDI
jgi:hypothetical protein